MNDTSQIIASPEGGGALSGIGEKFSPDLHTGTGNFTVPIALPPGRNGFQPELSLVYSTGQGNSAFGLGWNLSIPGVSRKTSKGVPRYDDAQDTFILSGAEDLVPVNIRDNLTQYRPRTEGLFAHIARHHDQENDYWEVKSKDGLRSFYGTRPESRPENAGENWEDPAIIAKPNERNKVFAWKLTETLDPFNNRIAYEYERDSDMDELRSPDFPVPEDSEKKQHHWDQLYLKRIWYADHKDGKPSSANFLVSVTFNYSKRPDSFSEYRPGFEIRSRLRCKNIEVRTHADPSQPTLVRTYQLIYLDERVGVADEGLPKSLLPLNDISLLSQVKVVGHDGSEMEELPPLEFGYTQFNPDRRDLTPLTGELPTQSLSDPNVDIADVFGNGLPDLIQTNGTVRYWRNLGNGNFDLPRQMNDAPAGIGLADPGVQLIDADGDGRLDLLVTRNGLSGYFPMKHDGEWDRRSFKRYRQAPTFSLQDPEVQLVDLDGDGVTDAIRSGSRLECFFNDAETGWQRTRQVPRRDIAEFPNVNFSDPRVRWTDMTGDGLQDIVLIHDGNVEYYPSLGHGNWHPRIHMENSPRFPYGYNPQHILVGDVDGDGAADLVHVENGKVTLWMNQSGNRWSDPIEINGTPPLTDIDSVRLVDVLGTGIRGVLWSKNQNGSARSNAFFLNFTGQEKPYLLNQMNNHLGAVTRVEYTSSTKFYQQDWQERRPWKTTLPFPVQVVSRVEVIDELSGGKLTTEYRYHHGYWDGVEREFRGFGMVEQRDTETFEQYNASGLHGKAMRFNPVDNPERFSPPTLIKTWFHQGPVADVNGMWEEADYGDEYWSGDAPMLERPTEMIDFLKKLPRRVRRDALRTLRGQVLRTELYALDGSEREDRPYTVMEQVHGVTSLPIEAPWPEDDGSLEPWQTKIFFPHTLAQRTTQWERGDDPKTQFAFTSDYNDFGTPRTQVAIACPRGWRTFADVFPQEKPFLSTMSRTVYAVPNDEVYIYGRVAKATTYEVLHQGDQTLTDIRNAAQDATRLRVIGQTLNYYDGNQDFEGLPLKEVGEHGVLKRSESLVMTEEIVKEAYKSGDTIANPPEMPPYLNPSQANDTTQWGDEYPEKWKKTQLSFAGYVYREGDAESADGYFSITSRRKLNDRGLVVTQLDPMGNETRIEYDDFMLLPIKAIQLARIEKDEDTGVQKEVLLETQAVYDYRVMQPVTLKDANENEQTFRFSPLGLLTEQYIRSRRDANGVVQEGDDQVPSLRLEYDFLAFENSPRDNPLPVWVRSIRRVYHDTDTTAPLDRKDETIETVEYSDGFGRLLQTRAQAEDVIFGDPVFGNGVVPADQSDRTATRALVEGVRNTDLANPNVVVSGWQTYDNKGQVVEAYEPFYAQGWDYLSREEAVELRDQGGADLFGQKVTNYYDPRGQVIRTLNPDSSEQWVIYGVPGTIATPDLNNPDNYEPTPWEAYTYDAGDNAGRTHGSAAQSFEHYWNTPASIEIDALGRTITAVERNRSHGTSATDAVEEHITRNTYDIQGNLLTVTDALNREAFHYTYSLVPESAPLRIESIDAGVRRVMVDAAGREIERRDLKGSLILHQYDGLNRLKYFWAKDKETDQIKMRQRVVYGDDRPLIDWDTIKPANLLGKTYEHYDEAGRVRMPSYDFKGNALSTVRQVIKDEHLLAVYQPDANGDWNIEPFQTSWEESATVSFDEHVANMLNPQQYEISSSLDALGRAKRMLYPEDVEGNRAELLPTYNRAGALEQVKLDGDIYVERIAYNARGQRTLIAYGNRVMTRYTYEPLTFRLARLRSEGYEQLETLKYKPAQKVLQDYGYDYDLVSNILQIRDRTPQSGIPNTTLGRNALNRLFKYDAIYQLTKATGRECDQPPASPPWDDTPRCTDPTLTRAYTRSYTYDTMGNMQQLHHEGFGSNQLAFNRGFTLRNQNGQSLNNQLQQVVFGGNPVQYRYDLNGNMTNEGTVRHFEWNHSDQLNAFRTQVNTSEPSMYAQYLYDAGGVRIIKMVRKQDGGYQVRVYVGEIFEHYLWSQNSNNSGENNRLHVMDDQQRIVLIRHGLAHPDDNGPALQFQLSDHLGSSNIVIGKDGNFINVEEHYPFGETSFGSFIKKRYRFIGRELDEESGLRQHHLRYYSAYLTRWISSDPAGPIDSLNLFLYAKNNPLFYSDYYGDQSDIKNVSNIDDPDNYDSFTDFSEANGDRTTNWLESAWDNRHKKKYLIFYEIDNETAPGMAAEMAKDHMTKAYPSNKNRIIEKMKQERPHVLVIMGHGFDQGVSFNNGKRGFLEDLSEIIRQGELNDGSEIVFNACNIGKRGDMLDKLQKKFPKIPIHGQYGSAHATRNPQKRNISNDKTLNEYLTENFKANYTDLSDDEINSKVKAATRSYKETKYNELERGKGEISTVFRELPIFGYDRYAYVLITGDYNIDISDLGLSPEAEVRFWKGVDMMRDRMNSSN